MKNFKSYISNILTEADTDKNEKTPTAIENILALMKKNKADLEVIFKNFTYENNELKYKGETVEDEDIESMASIISKNADLKKKYEEVKKKDTEPAAKKAYSLIDKEINSNQSSTYRKSENDFKKLGEAIVYRTACSFKSDSDDFSKICKQIFENDSDDRIKSLSSIELQFGEYGAYKGFEEYKEKNKDTKDDEALNILEKCNPYFDIIKNQNSSEVELNDAIGVIATSIPQEFKKYYDSAKSAFDEGVKTMQKNIKDPNFDWKDPITGKPAEGLDNIKATITKLSNKIGEKADQLGKSIMSKPHNLENDILKVGVIAVKCLVGGTRALTAAFKLFGIGGDKTRTSSANVFIKGCKDDSTSIKRIIGNFTKWFNANSKKFNKLEQSTKTTDKDINAESFSNYLSDTLLNEAEVSPEEIKEIRNLFFNDKNGFKNTGYHILDYITKNYGYLIELSNGLEKKIFTFNKIENAEDENTYGFNFTMSGKLPMIQDKLNLYIKSIKYYQEFYNVIANKYPSLAKKLFIGDIIINEHVFDNSIDELKKSITFLKKYDQLNSNSEFINTLDSINKIYDAKKGFFQITKEMVKIKTNPGGWSTNGYSIEKFNNKCSEVINSLQSINIKAFGEAIPVTFADETALKDFVSNVSLTFGVENLKIEEKPEENTEMSEEESTLEKQYKAIRQEIEELSNINDNDTKLNKMDELTAKLEEIDDKAQHTYEELWDIVEQKPNKDEYESLKIDKDNTPVLQKIINIKAIMTKLGIKESTVLKNIEQLLFEATEQDSNTLNKIKDEIKSIFDKEFTDEDIKNNKELYNHIVSEIEKLIADADEKEKEDLIKIKENPMLLFALGDKKEDEDDKKKAQPLVNDTKNIINNLQPEDIFKEGFYDKLETEWKNLEDNILKNFNEEKFTEYAEGFNMKLDQLKDNIVAEIWFAKQFLRKVFENYNPFSDITLLYLLEAEENQEDNEEDVKKEIQSLSTKISDLIEINDEEQFKNAYKEWKEKINSLFEKFGDKIENRDSMKDPVQQLSAMGLYFKNKQETQETESNQ